jgi:hypothetical protein
MKKKKAGRPSLRKGISPRRTFRIADRDWARWCRAAKRAGISTGELIRSSVEKELG